METLRKIQNVQASRKSIRDLRLNSRQSKDGAKPPRLSGRRIAADTDVLRSRSARLPAYRRIVKQNSGHIAGLCECVRC